MKSKKEIKKCIASYQNRIRHYESLNASLSQSYILGEISAATYNNELSTNKWFISYYRAKVEALSYVLE